MNLNRKSVLLLLLLGLTFVIQGKEVKTQDSGEESEEESSEEEEAPEEDEHPYSPTFDGNGEEAECDGTYPLPLSGAVTINAGTEPLCNYTLIGDSECQPVIRCEVVNIKGDGADCEDTYLEIADAWGGVHRVCGNAQLSEKGVRASYGARDLFITVAGHPGGEVQCEATCGNGRDLGDFLGKAKKRKVDKRCVCGIQNLDDRIVNGEDAKKFEFPWLAAIVNYGTRTPFCGSSLVNDRWILTAAHCFWFSGMKAEEIQVLLHAHLLDATVVDGANDEAELGEQGSLKGRGYDMKSVSDDSERTIRLDIHEVIMHPLFTAGYDFDACLLRMSHPIDLATVEATPICLPKVGESRDFVGEIVTVSGWGMPDELAGSTTRLLQKLNVPVLELADCAKMMEFDLTERMFCAGFVKGVQDSCTGDSGGALKYKQENGQFMQVGIVSWGEGCARENRPGIYSRVTDLSDWIQYHMRKSNPIWCRESVDAEDDE